MLDAVRDDRFWVFPHRDFLGLAIDRFHRIESGDNPQAKTDIFFYIEGFYNRKRRHSTLGYLSPETFEAAFQDHQSVLTVCPQK